MNELLAMAMSEAELQQNIIEIAHALGYKVAHFRPAMTQRGTWVTPVQADGANFPDLVLAKPGRVLFMECKSQRGQPTDGQDEWGVFLSPNYYLVRPSDWLDGTIEKILKGI